jgi:signal peptide peptidase SppA
MLLRFGAIWAIEPDRGRAAFHTLSQTDTAAHVAAYQGAVNAGERQPLRMGLFVGSEGQDGWDYGDPNGAGRRRKPYQMDGGVAIFELNGEMMKEPSSWDDSAGTVGMRRSIRRAKADPDVTAGVLVIDSPGGSVAGTAELAADVAAFAKVKPLYAFCDDLCASAAYYVASQANAIYANRSALVGSIGVFMVVYDLSQMAEQEGIAVHVIRDGDMKGAGAPGTPITDAQKAHWQEIVSGYGRQFRSAVMRGRSMSADALAPLADGKVFFAEKARDSGLIDGVTTLDNVISKLKTYRPA